MAGPAPFSVGRGQPSWRGRWALLAILEAAELTLAFLGPRLAGLAILAFLMPFTACQIFSDSSLGQRLFFRWGRAGGSAPAPSSPADGRWAGPARVGSPAARAIGDRLRTLARRSGGPRLPTR